MTPSQRERIEKDARELADECVEMSHAHIFTMSMEALTKAREDAIAEHEKKIKELTEELHGLKLQIEDSQRGGS